jgi:hypothetical protein
MSALTEKGRRGGLCDVLIQTHVLYPVLIRTRNSYTGVDFTTCLTLLGAPRELFLKIEAMYFFWPLPVGGADISFFVMASFMMKASIIPAFYGTRRSIAVFTGALHRSLS